MTDQVTFYFHDRDQGNWYAFKDLVSIVTSHDVNSVLDQLKVIEEFVQQGKIAAGYIHYEAAPAFDPSFITHDSDTFPLLWFGVFDSYDILESLPKPNKDYTLSPWISDINETQYNKDIQKIKTYIAAGDTYQVNHTYRLNSRFEGDAYKMFHDLVQNQLNNYASFIETDEFAICSISPELFFRLEDTEIQCRPMKGTIPRGMSYKQDMEQKKWLASSEKNKAENVMIVDMVRNDLGHIAQPGSVQVPSLFDLEKHPTLWQMTSSVIAQTKSTVPDIFKALFPCASITGAPKTRTMEIIHELEKTPRNLYTGSIGYWMPNLKALFNVAIRTTSINKKTGQADYGVGGGIVWDSEADHEFHETQVKARVLFQKPSEFQIIETLLWTGQEYFLLNEHQKRMQQSADYFDYCFDENKFQNSLNSICNESDHKKRVRILLNREEQFTIESYHIVNNEYLEPVRLRFSKGPINIQSPFIYHKTTIRDQYLLDSLLRKGVDDILFWNDKGEITEASIYNIVVSIDDILYTPPVACGLLPGTFRNHLLKKGKIETRIIYKDEITSNTDIYVINSVRQWQKAIIVK